MDDRLGPSRCPATMLEHHVVNRVRKRHRDCSSFVDIWQIADVCNNLKATQKRRLGRAWRRNTARFECGRRSGTGRKWCLVSWPISVPCRYKVAHADSWDRRSGQSWSSVSNVPMVRDIRRAPRALAKNHKPRGYRVAASWSENLDSEAAKECYHLKIPLSTDSDFRLQAEKH